MQRWVHGKEQPDTVNTLGISGTEQSQKQQNPLNGEKFQVLSLTGPAVKREDIFQAVFHVASFPVALWHSRFVSKTLDLLYS